MHGYRGLTGVAPLLVALLLLGFSSLTIATPLYEVPVPPKEQLRELTSLGLDIIHGPDHETLMIVGWDGTAEALDALGLPYSVYVEDVVAWNQARLGNTIDDMGGYPTYSEYQAWMVDFCNAHPDIVEGPTTLGYSLQGRQIDAIKISDNPGVDEDEPELFINALIHAREVVTALSLQMLAEDLAAGYGNDPRITNIVDNREIWLVLIMNPDGYVENENIAPNGGGMHRKNMNPPDGVDLNRNWDYMWGLDDQGSSPDPFDATYRGESPGSEPATIVIKNFINSREFSSVLNLHTYSDLILLPWGFTYVRPPQWDTYLAFGNELNSSLGWEVGGPEIIYLTNGGAADWQAAGDPDEPTSADYRMWSLTYEIGSFWEGGFWPNISTGIQQAEEVQESYLTFLEVGANPLVLGAPVPPVMTTAGTVPPEFTLEWTHDDPNGNDAVAYDVAELTGPVTIDGAETYELIGWTWDGFQRSGQRAHSGSYSYWGQSANNLNHSMTTDFTYTVQPDDDITLWCWYDIEEDWDYAYVMVSTDGSTFETIPGNITTDDNPNGTNQGNGITGVSGGWVQGVFPLDDFVGEDIYIRVAYVTDGGVSEPGFWFEEMTPFLGFEDSEILASNLGVNELEIDYGDVPDDVTAYFTARAIDVDDDISAWADPAVLTIDSNAAPADLDLTVINNTVPGNGGTVTYSLSLETYVGQTFPGVTWWTMVMLPNGNEVGPVSQQTVTIPGFADIDIPLMTLDVPGYAPGGFYTFTGNLGYYPQSVLDDSFTFLKIGGLEPGRLVNEAEATSYGFKAGDLPLDAFAAGDEAVAVPKRFALSQAYPNPFNPTTSITLSLPENAEVTVAVYDILGQQVATLTRGTLSAGEHRLTFDGTDVASGVYFIHADAAAIGEQVRKVVLMK